MKKTEIRIIKDRIKRGIKYWEDECEKKFKRFHNYLRIKHYSGHKAETDRVTVPYVHSIVRTKLPAIYLQNPKFLTKPKKEISLESKELTLTNLKYAQSMMDYLPEEIDMESECRRAVLDFLGYGRGVAKVGFEFESEGESEEDLKILVDRFFVKRIAYPSGFFIYDPESTNGLRGAGWCAEKIVEPLVDVKAKKYFENTKDLKANSRIDEKLTQRERETKEEERLEYYYYWEKNRFGLVDKMLIIVPDQDTLLNPKNTANPYDNGEWPYEDLDNYDVPDYLFPVGDIEPLETQQNELDKTESLLFTHLKRFIQKYKTKKGTLDSKAKEAFQTPENALIEVAGELDDLRPLENPSVSQTVPLATREIKDDITHISGISEYQRGAIPARERTLGEAQMVQAGSAARSSDALKQVEKFMKRIGRKLLQVCQQYMTSEMLIRIAGDGTAPDDWLNITPEQIQGEFDIEIEPHSTAPVNQEILKRQALDIYNLFRNDPEIQFEGRNELRRAVLEAFEHKNIDTILPKAPPMMGPGGMPGGMPEGMPGGEGMPPGMPGQEPVKPPEPVSRNQLYQKPNLY